MIGPFVFDHTALVALFAGQSEVYGLWATADRAESIVVFPAAAMAEASNWNGADDDAWRVLLMPGRVRVAPLDQSTAIGSRGRAGCLAARQAMYESSATSGAIVTRAPWQYPRSSASVVVVVPVDLGRPGTR